MKIPKHQNAKMPKRQNAKMPKCQNKYGIVVADSVLVPGGLRVGPPTCKYMYLHCGTELGASECGPVQCFTAYSKSSPSSKYRPLQLLSMAISPAISAVIPAAKVGERATGEELK